MVSNHRPVLIMAGGTGGHVYPALAVAKMLQKQSVPVVWMGTRKGLEARVIPENGIDIKWLSIGGLRGKSKLTLALAPFKLVVACLQALLILRRVKPRCVLGMGGFVSGPGGLMASFLNIPLVVHEQNAVPGLTNRKLASRANVVLQAFPGAFVEPVGAQYVGNPVRQDIMAIGAPAERIRMQGALRLLVVGGSLGAQALNELVPQALAKLDVDKLLGGAVQIRHQAGGNKRDAAAIAYRTAKVEAQVDGFIEDMATAYEWADLVICRSGAMTVAELSAAGVASILVPYPHAVDDHQTENALFLAKDKAAVMIPQRELEVDQLAKWLEEFIQNRDKLLKMAEAAREHGMPESTQLVVDALLKQGGV